MRIKPLLFVALLAFAPVVRGQDAEKKVKTVRLLCIGNSFSQNATKNLRDLTKAGGHVLIHTQASIGGASMQTHWDKTELHEKDAKDPRGIYTAGKGLREILASEPWDFVTIQQSSIKSHDIKTYRPYAGQLSAYVKKHAPKSALLIHQTWAYRIDDPRFAAAAPKEGEPRTRQEMHRGLTAAYREIAAELGAGILPVGDAFDLADSDEKWGYKVDAKFDIKKANAPALPDQSRSLHVGWRWAKATDGTPALRIDGHHAGVAGEYLGGCVFYEVIFGESVVGNTFRPAGIDAEYAKFLQETAHRAVEASRRK